MDLRGKGDLDDLIRVSGRQYRRRRYWADTKELMKFDVGLLSGSSTLASPPKHTQQCCWLTRFNFRASFDCFIDTTGAPLPPSLSFFHPTLLTSQVCVAQSGGVEDNEITERMNEYDAHDEATQTPEPMPEFQFEVSDEVEDRIADIAINF